jgi:hypothetical protein
VAATQSQEGRVKESYGPIVRDGATRRPASTPASVAGLVPPLIAFGLVLLGVGMVDLGFAWLPLRFGVGEWEFGTASRTFDSMALGTTGFAMLVAASAVRNRPAELRVLGVLSLLVVLFLLGAAFLYVRQAPMAMAQVPEQARDALSRAMVRTALFAGLYVVLFSWFSWFTWRRAGAASKEVS